MAGSHTNVCACEQAQPVLHARVLLCRVALQSSALQVEETGPLVAAEQQKRERESKTPCCLAHRRDGWHWLCPRCRQTSEEVCLAVVVVVVVSSGSAQQLQRRVLINMRNGGGVGGRAVCSFVTRSSSGGAASIPAIRVGEASHPSAACWCVGSGNKEEGERGVQHTV